MTEKERNLRIAAAEANSRAAIFEDAANGDWLHDPINYFAGISERQAAKRYLAEADAVAKASADKSEAEK